MVSSVVIGLLAGCTGDVGSDRADRSQVRPSSSTPVPSTAPPRPAGVPEALHDPYFCRGGFVCAGLDVPLDRAEPDGETLRLQVALEAEQAAPRGVLLALNGGPGAPGAPLAETVEERLGPDVVAAYRIVAIDQRGTGVSALQCPTLQHEGARRFVPSAAAVRSCASDLGPARGDYGTDATVADLDSLRELLGAPRLTIFAVSYGTFVAQQYAIAHPARTSALVLDSAVPAGGVDTLQVDVARAAPRVLRSACRAAGCPGDPVADLAAVARGREGAELFDLLGAMSNANPRYDSLLPALRRAARGDPAALDELLATYRGAFDTTSAVFSAGLHAAAFCGDQRFPWGRSNAPLAGRKLAVRRAVARAGDVYPFSAASIAGGSGVRECLPWPPVRPSRVRLGRPALPDVPTLFLSGGRDLAAPVESIRADAARASRGRLVVVPRAGHLVTAQSERGRRIARDFLLR